MWHLSKHRLSTWAAACTLAAACLAPNGASAALITFSYAGSVTGNTGDTRIQSIPNGTAVAWEFTFDNGFHQPTHYPDLIARAEQDIDGWLLVGSDRIDLNRFAISRVLSDPLTNQIVEYIATVSGIGPTIFDGGEFLRLDVLLAPTFDAIRLQPNIVYRWTTPPPVRAGVLFTDGNASIGPAHTVPLPATAWLVLPALAWLVRRPRKSSEPVEA